MTDKFKQVSYEEFEPDAEAQRVVDNYVDGNPWILLSVSASESEPGLSFNMEAGGGLPLEYVEPLLQKALWAFRQGREQQVDQRPAD
jgi:hypothetical protein